MKKINVDADLMIHTVTELEVSDNVYNQIIERGELSDDMEEIYRKLYDELLEYGEDNLSYYVFDESGSKIIATN